MPNFVSFRRIRVTDAPQGTSTTPPVVKAGKMAYRDALGAYLSWRGSILKQDARRVAWDMNKVFYGHFGKWPYTKKEMKKRGIYIN